MNLLGSITDLRPEHAGQPVLAGSHGGRVTGLFAAACGLSGLICHDAGIGLDEAGVAALAILDDYGTPAAAVDCMSARIGDPDDMLRHGVLSRVNPGASAIGIQAGMTVRSAMRILQARQAGDRRFRDAPPMPTAIFTRALREVEGGDPASAAVLLDSASSIGPEDEGKFVITGSHGGLPGSSTTRAVKAAVRLVVFNDAGIGKDDAGAQRLAALERLGIAGLCVSTASARIGEAASTYETGIVSVCNAAAGKLTIRPGDRVKDLHAQLARVGSTA